MRISTSFSHLQSVNAMLTQQFKLARTQLQLSTGERILTPADDPSGSAKALTLRKGVEQLRQFQNNIGVVRSRLALEETTLSSVTGVLHRVRELAVQGLNDSNSQNDRKMIATEILQLKDELLGLANTKGPNGEYLFAGYASKTKPFEETAISVTTVTSTVDTFQYTYQGDANNRTIPISATTSLADSDDGLTVFGVPFDHGTPPSTLPSIPVSNSVFDVLNKLAADLTADAPDSAILDDLDGAAERVLEARTVVGARLNALDLQENINEDVSLKLETFLSEIKDLDYAEAISRFNLENVALQAAQQAYIKVQGLSLFNFLR
ncbi:MAG: flagellar hook-associated protein FlgL [Pseudomonadota bacterium]